MRFNYSLILHSIQVMVVSTQMFGMIFIKHLKIIACFASNPRIHNFVGDHIILQMYHTCMNIKNWSLEQYVKCRPL